MVKSGVHGTMVEICTCDYPSAKGESLLKNFLSYMCAQSWGKTTFPFSKHLSVVVTNLLGSYLPISNIYVL